jgi:hypothetical protein
MAYAVTYHTPVFSMIDGRRHVYQKITETGGGAADEWQLGVPLHITITDYRSKLTVAGAATTVDPELGTEASFVAGENGPATVAAASFVRNTENARMTCPDLILRGRTKPDGVAGTVVTHLSYVEGHI